jgi:hypothetical protein
MHQSGPDYLVQGDILPYLWIVPSDGTTSVELQPYAQSMQGVSDAKYLLEKGKRYGVIPIVVEGSSTTIMDYSGLNATPRGFNILNREGTGPSKGFLSFVLTEINDGPDNVKILNLLGEFRMKTFRTDEIGTVIIKCDKIGICNPVVENNIAFKKLLRD